MHGRLKVKTTAQQEAEKARERKVKVAKYREAMRNIMQWRKQEQMEKPLLMATAGVLQANPDINTLWNIRRECFLKLNEKAAEEKPESGPASGIDGEKQLNGENGPEREPEDKAEALAEVEDQLASDAEGERKVEAENGPAPNKADTSQTMSKSSGGFDADKALRAELDLTQQCLMANPKSYGAWHHRCWSMDQMKRPDWQREAALTAKYLKMDSRNFHCWDYRRFVAKSAGFSDAHELDFAMMCIGDNFSNYSAWHVRSKLLPSCFPAALADDGRGTATGVAEERMREEIDLVQQAAFTDPDDSSAWFYHTWLVQGCSSGATTGGARPAAMARMDENAVLVSFDSPVPKSAFEVSGASDETAKSWATMAGHAKASKLWELQASDIVISVKTDAGQLTLSQNEDFCTATTAAGQALEATTKEALKEDLSNCEQLLELEPDSKWALLAKVMLLEALDQREDEVEPTLDRLMHVDKMRKNYFS